MNTKKQNEISASLLKRAFQLLDELRKLGAERLPYPLQEYVVHWQANELDEDVGRHVLSKSLNELQTLKGEIADIGLSGGRDDQLDRVGKTLMRILARVSGPVRRARRQRLRRTGAQDTSNSAHEKRMKLVELSVLIDHAIEYLKWLDSKIDDVQDQKEETKGGVLRYEIHELDANELEMINGLTRMKLASLPKEKLESLQTEVDYAVLVKSFSMLGLPEGSEISSVEMNTFLFDLSQRKLSDDEKIQVTGIVRAFKEMADRRLFFDGKECNLDTSFAKERKIRRFVVRVPGQGGKVLTQVNQLPEGLRFE